MKTQRGFTIVELLVVIVVIAVLAAITVVAYNGVQNRAKNSQYQTDVATIAKKSELYPHASGTGSYPLVSAGPDLPSDSPQTNAGKLLTSGINSYIETKLPSNIIIFGVLTAASSIPTNAQALTAIGNSGTRGYFVKYCSTGRGMYIYYPDVNASSTANAPSRTVGICP